MVDDFVRPNEDSKRVACVSVVRNQFESVRYEARWLICLALQQVVTRTYSRIGLAQIIKTADRVMSDYKEAEGRMVSSKVRVWAMSRMAEYNQCDEWVTPTDAPRAGQIVRCLRHPHRWYYSRSRLSSFGTHFL